jgi:coenzyme F420-reducing hydrogenase alpha subunit
MNKKQLKRIVKEEFLSILKTASKPKNNKRSLNEHWLGELPSEKLMKMKWNPVTDPIQEDVYDSSDLKTPYPDSGDPDQSFLDDMEANELERLVRPIEKFYNTTVRHYHLDTDGQEALRHEIISFIQNGL